MTQPYGIIKAQKFDIQGNSTAGEPNNNDWRLVVDNELYKLKYYDSSNQTFSTLETIDTSGNVTIPGNLQIVGNLDFASATMKGSIVPDTNDAYDIGSPEYKIRDIFVSESSLWIGDEHKVTISGGKMKFRKRKTTTVPAAITAAGGTAAGAKTLAGNVANLTNVKLKHWRNYLRQLTGDNTKKVRDVFRTTSDDYDEEQGADSWLESGNNIYLGVLGNVGIGDSSPSYKLDVNGDINFTGTLYQNGSEFTSGGSSNWTTSGNNIYLGASGNVGVGDSTPSYKLDVNGTGRFTGNLTCDSNFIGNLTGNADTVTNGIYTTSSITALSDVSSAGSGAIITTAERTLLNAINTNAKIVHCDASRTDSYTEGGTKEYPYKTLTAAISAKTDDSNTDTLIFYLEPGTYVGTINKTKATANQEIHIIGRDRDSVKIAGSSSWNTSTGIVLFLRKFTNISIQNVTIMNGSYGFYPRDCSKTSIINCKFIYCGSSGNTTMHDGSGSATQQAKYKWSSGDALATHTSNGGAMRIRNCIDLDIRDNIVTYCFRGFRIQDCKRGKIQNNRVYKILDNGIYLASGSYTGSTSYGCENIAIINNDVEYCGHHGLVVIGGRNNTFYGNVIKHSWATCMNVAHSINVDIINNYFIDNNSKDYNGYGANTEHLAQIYAYASNAIDQSSTTKYFINITNNTFEDSGTGSQSETRLLHITSASTEFPSGARNLLVSNNIHDCAEVGTLNDWTFSTAKLTTRVTELSDMTSAGSGSIITTLERSKVNAAIQNTGNETIAGVKTFSSAIIADFTGIVNTAAQPNITSVGTLTSLNVSGNSGFSGMVCSFVGERNSTSNTAGIAFSFGNGSTAIHGPTMPVAGKVIGMTFSSTVNCYCEIELWINNSATGKVLECGTYTFGGPPPSGSNYWEYTYAKTAKTTSVNKTFNAEDRIQIKIKAIDGTKTGEYSDRGTESNTGTISYPVATFFIKYD